MSKIPKLRFPEFCVGENREADDNCLSSVGLEPKAMCESTAEGWEEKEYGDIYSFYSTNSFSRDNLNNEKVIAGLHTFLARPKKNNIALGFMGYLLQSWNVRKQVMTIAQGTKVLSLSTSRLGKIKLLLPQKQEQEKIITIFKG